MESRTATPVGDEALVPHVLRAAIGESYLAMRGGAWCESQLEAAFVFPSFQLAQRYAAAFYLQDIGAFVPIAARGRAPSIGVAGDPFVVACEGCGCTELFACPDRCHWHRPGLCSACARGAEPSTWAVYERPSDYPGGFLARQYVGVVPTETHIKGASLEEVRAKLPPGMACVGRTGLDDRRLVEVWV